EASRIQRTTGRLNSLPQNCSPLKIGHLARGRNTTLVRLHGTKEPLVNAGSVLTSVTLRLVTHSRIRFWKRFPQVQGFLFGRDSPCRFRTYSCSVSQPARPPAGLSLWTI